MLLASSHLVTFMTPNSGLHVFLVNVGNHVIIGYSVSVGNLIFIGYNSGYDIKPCYNRIFLAYY
jgi:hypothetical protein